MRKLFFVFKTLLATLIAFVLINTTTSKFESYFDGCDKIGFPFTFYHSCQGMATDFSLIEIHYLILDLSIIASIVLFFFIKFIPQE